MFGLFGLFLIPKSSLHITYHVIGSQPDSSTGGQGDGLIGTAPPCGRTEQYTEAAILPPSLVGTELTCINIGIICRNITKEADANGDVDESLYRGHIHLYATGKVENARGFNP